MNFFRLRRTKMIDEAALNHKPQSLLISLLIFYLVYFIAQTISSVLISIPTAIWMLTDKDFIEAMNQYTESVMSGNTDTSGLTAYIQEMATNMPAWLWLVSLFVYAGLIVTAIFYCKKFEKRPLSSMGIRKKHILREYGLGALIGAVMFSIVYLIAFLCGAVSIEASQEGFSYMIILFLLGFIVQGASEEIMLRGYYMITVARDYRPATAIAVSSVLFGLFHGGNNGYSILALINIILFGVFLGVYVFKRGDLWGACAIHTMWNFVQGNIFGSSVSGMTRLPSIFVTEMNENMQVANGGAFGLEAGVATTIVLLVAIALVFLLKTKKGEESLSDATDFE